MITGARNLIPRNCLGRNLFETEHLEIDMTLFGLELWQLGAGFAVSLGSGYLIYRLTLRERYREKVLDWHRDTKKKFSEVRSLGTRMNIPRKADPEYLEEIRPIAAELHSDVNHAPFWITARVNHNVMRRIRIAAGVVYHFAHLPTPQREADSIAGLIYHWYELIELLDLDSEIQVREVLEKFGNWDAFDDPNVNEEEGKRLLEEFEAAAEGQLTDWEAMTVEELMDLPWDRVDRVFSESDREQFIDQFVHDFSEQALVDLPADAIDVLSESEMAIGL